MVRIREGIPTTPTMKIMLSPGTAGSDFQKSDHARAGGQHPMKIRRKP